VGLGVLGGKIVGLWQIRGLSSPPALLVDRGVSSRYHCAGERYAEE